MPKMNYGVPYQGSKSRIATLIMNELPEGKRFVDLMAGGKTAKQRAIENLYIHRKWLNGEIERIVEQIVENTGNGGK